MSRNRPVLRQHMGDLLLEIAQLGKIVTCGIAGGAGEAGKLDLRVGDRVAAVGLVGSVVRHEMDEVLRRDSGDGHQAAEIHQQAAVALQADNALIRTAERQPEPVRGIQPHGADGKIIERARLELDPIDGRAIGRNHGLVGDMARQERGNIRRVSS